MVWLARNREGCGCGATSVYTKDPGDISSGGQWCHSSYVSLAIDLGLPEIPHGTKREVALAATPVPQPTRAAELWGIWHPEKGWDREHRGAVETLYLGTSEVDAKKRMDAIGVAPGWQVRRYDTCPVEVPQ